MGGLDYQKHWVRWVWADQYANSTVDINANDRMCLSRLREGFYWLWVAQTAHQAGNRRLETRCALRAAECVVDADLAAPDSHQTSVLRLAFVLAMENVAQSVAHSSTPHRLKTHEHTSRVLARARFTDLFVNSAETHDRMVSSLNQAFAGHDVAAVNQLSGKAAYEILLPPSDKGGEGDPITEANVAHNCSPALMNQLSDRGRPMWQSFVWWLEAARLPLAAGHYRLALACMNIAAEYAWRADLTLAVSPSNSGPYASDWPTINGGTKPILDPDYAKKQVVVWSIVRMSEIVRAANAEQPSPSVAVDPLVVKDTFAAMEGLVSKAEGAYRPDIKGEPFRHVRDSVHRLLLQTREARRG